MDSETKQFYIVDKEKLDKLVEFLGNTYKVFDDLSKVHDDILEILKESLVHEMGKMNDILAASIDSIDK